MKLILTIAMVATMISCTCKTETVKEEVLTVPTDTTTVVVEDSVNLDSVN